MFPDEVSKWHIALVVLLRVVVLLLAALTGATVDQQLLDGRAGEVVQLPEAEPEQSGSK